MSLTETCVGGRVIFDLLPIWGSRGQILRRVHFEGEPRTWEWIFWEHFTNKGMMTTLARGRCVFLHRGSRWWCLEEPSWFLTLSSLNFLLTLYTLGVHLDIYLDSQECTPPQKLLFTDTPCHPGIYFSSNLHLLSCSFFYSRCFLMFSHATD